MCLEIVSQYYCGHRVISKEVCQAAHITENLPKRSFFSKIFGKRRAPKTKCEIRSVNKYLTTPCQRCSANPELRQFIQSIPSHIPETKRIDMITVWKTQNRSALARISVDPRRAETQARFENFLCSRCTQLPSWRRKRLPTGMCCVNGKWEWDRDLEARRQADRSARRQHREPRPSRKVLPPNPPPVPPLPSTMPMIPQPPRGRQPGSSEQTRTGRPSRRIASPSKYLDPRGYQRDTTPAPRPRRSRTNPARAPPSPPPRTTSLKQSQSVRSRRGRQNVFEGRPLRSEIEREIDRQIEDLEYQQLQRQIEEAQYQQYLDREAESEEEYQRYLDSEAQQEYSSDESEEQRNSGRRY